MNKSQNQNLNQQKEEWEDEMPMCLESDEPEDLERFKGFMDPYMSNLFGSDEFGECAASDLPEELGTKISEADNYASAHIEDAKDYLKQPEFFANLIKISKEVGNYALDRYILDLENEIKEYTEQLRKYANNLAEVI